MSEASLVLTPVTQLISALETDDFYAEVAIASSPRAFYRRLNNHALTGALKQLLLADPDAADAVLNYAESLVRSISGTIRNDKDAALCACTLAMAELSNPRIDDFLRYLRTAKPLALRWAAEIAEIVSGMRSGTSRTELTWSGISSAGIASSQAGVTVVPDEPSNIGLTRDRR